VFDVVAENNYDKKYADITEKDKRPLGFKRYTIKYNDPSKNPCLSVKGLNQQMVEIMFQSIPEAGLCYRDQLGKEVCNEQSKHQSCTVYEADDMYFEFYPNVGVEWDINFWLRITRGSVNDAAMMWCDMRSNLFPESLRNMPTGAVVPAKNPPQYNDSSSSPRLLPGFLSAITAALLNLAMKLI